MEFTASGRQHPGTGRQFRDVVGHICWIYNLLSPAPYRHSTVTKCERIQSRRFHTGSPKTRERSTRSASTTVYGGLMCPPIICVIAPNRTWCAHQVIQFQVLSRQRMQLKYSAILRSLGSFHDGSQSFYRDSKLIERMTPRDQVQRRRRDSLLLRSPMPH